MAYVSTEPPKPKAPTPKVAAIRKIMLAFASLAQQHDLNERNEFRTLARIIDDAVVTESLLRSLYVEFLRQGRIELQIRFHIDWRTKSVTIASGKYAAETVTLDKGAEDADGEDFLRLVSKRLHALYRYVHERIVDGHYDDSNWTVELRENDRNRDVARQVEALKSKYGLRDLSVEYLQLRQDLETSNPVTATFTKKSLDMLLRMIHRR